MPEVRRIRREKQTISAMLAIYCRDHHDSPDGLCEECQGMLQYAHQRLDVCPFQAAKPACNHCRVHCYSKRMREQVKDVMRYAGPRMMLRHPVLSAYHLLDKFRKVPSLPSKLK